MINAALRNNKITALEIIAVKVINSILYIKYIIGMVRKKLKEQQIHKAIYLANIIFPGVEAVINVSRDPSSMSGFIKLPDRLIKAKGMLMTAKIIPKACIFS
ncbi:MAG: hypothetical protein NWS20_03070 [Rickettsiaceae bacterium]|nr:hypothetical protein [Rickettsiaceae bacterium]MDP4832842.1 hypothetical protein [Rickettsiaceae bacterium]MDP5020580.1 hypothetical protein [Rickettsiaceae bacterium]MDP5083228.1 hypothetical protein [Rickettsiaceae bacterium]